jgi:hypothetical protein
MVMTMQYPVQIQGFESQSIEVKAPGLFSGPKLLVNGQPAPKGPKRNQMALHRDDGAEAVAVWKPRLLGLDVPQIAVDGETIQVVEPLPWYQWLWSALPVLLVFAGGAIGAFAGVLALFVNIKLFRSSLNGVVKYLATAAASFAAVLVYFVLATMISAVL